MLTYACVFIGSLIGSVVLTRAVRKVATARGWVSRRRLGRDMHSRPIPRLGGVAVFLTIVTVLGGAGLVCTLLRCPWLLPAGTALRLLAPALVMFLVGLIDDVYSLRPHTKFAGQIAAALLLYAAGYGIHSLQLSGAIRVIPSFIGLPVTVLWVVLITNAFNLIDGLDGLMTGAAAFSTMVIFVFSIFTGDQVTSVLTLAIVGTLIGFLRYNFNPATIFLGDCGSLLIGFLLSALALAQSQKATTLVAVAIPVVAFGLPIVDVAITVLRRFLSGKPLFSADGEHIHHKLLRRGFSQRTAVLILYCVSASFAALSMLLINPDRWRAGTVLSVLGIGVLVGVQQLRYAEFLELLRVARRTLDQKKIIANNLGVRRAIENLPVSSGLGEIGEFLRRALEPIGFRGIVLEGHRQARAPDPTGTPFSRAPGGALQFFWADAEALHPVWSLRIELVTTQGKKWGSATLVREDGPAPLLMDITLFSSAFSTALADALQRTCRPLEPKELRQVPVVREEKARPPLRVARPRWHPGITSPQA